MRVRFVTMEREHVIPKMPSGKPPALVAMQARQTRQSKIRPRHEPTEAEIREQTAAFRATWTHRETLRRAGIDPDRLPTIKKTRAGIAIAEPME